MAIDRRQITDAGDRRRRTPRLRAGFRRAFPATRPRGSTGPRCPPTSARAGAGAVAAQHAKRGAAPAHLTLCTDASANHRRTAVALADQWRRALGVDVTIVEMEWKAYLAMREQPGDCDLLRFGWSADFVDAEAFLALFASGHAQNVAGYSNASLRRAAVEVGALPPTQASARRFSPGGTDPAAGRRRHPGVPSRLEAAGQAWRRRRRGQSAGTPGHPSPAPAANPKK